MNNTLTIGLMYLHVSDQLNQDFLLLFGAEKASKMLEKWDTAFRPKVIKEAKHLTQSTELCRLLKAAEKLAENDDTSKLHDMLGLYSKWLVLFTLCILSRY